MSVYAPLIGFFINYIEKNPEKNMLKMADFLERIAVMPNHKEDIKSAKRVLEEKDSNWCRLILRGLKHVDKGILKRMTDNFIIKATLKGIPKQQRLAKKFDINIPWAILIDPTEACNLRCTGCWAGDYELHNLSFEVMDRVCREAEKLGIYFVVVSGGEPLIRKKELLELAKRHKNQIFHVFTNGTLIDEEFLAEVKKVRNMVFAISIEGFKESTDSRRGEGVFDKIMNAMDLCRKYGVVFGFSATYTRNNTEEVGSDEFVDLMIDKGCYFGWYFTYIPVGKDVDFELMATPEQRKFMYNQVNKFRNSKDIFVVDFWNDGEFSGGCIAGGRRYIHINAKGDVEPCAFIHYANVNIKEVSLLDALKSPIMKAYKKRQPFNNNMLMPCPLIDNPDKLLEIVNESNAYNTQINDDSDIRRNYERLRNVSERWRELADDIWENRNTYNM